MGDAPGDHTQQQGAGAPGPSSSSRKHVVWDEHNLAENAIIQAEFAGVTVPEPKTPYHGPSPPDDLEDDLRPLALGEDGEQANTDRGGLSAFEYVMSNGGADFRPSRAKQRIKLGGDDDGGDADAAAGPSGSAAAAAGGGEGGSKAGAASGSAGPSTSAAAATAAPSPAAAGGASPAPATPAAAKTNAPPPPLHMPAGTATAAAGGKRSARSASEPRSFGTSSDGSAGRCSSEKRQRFEAVRRAHYNMRDALRLGRRLASASGDDSGSGSGGSGDGSGDGGGSDSDSGDEDDERMRDCGSSRLKEAPAARGRGTQQQQQQQQQEQQQQTSNGDGAHGS